MKISLLTAVENILFNENIFILATIKRQVSTII